MADDLDSSTPDYGAITDQVMSHVATYIGADVIVDTLAKALLKALSALAIGLGNTVAPIAMLGGKALVAAEEPILPVFAAFVAPIVASMFDTEVDAAAFSARSNREGRGNAARALVEAYMKALAGDADGEIEPTDEGAKRVATAGVHAAIEGWFNSWILEMLGECVPWEWMHFKEMTAFPEEVIEALGIGNMTQRALRPLVDATARTPMRWATNKKYRPTELSTGEIASAFLRGDYTQGEAAEELARLGYSDKRQDVILKSAVKWMSIADSLVLVRDGLNDRSLAIENAKLQGFDDVGAEAAVLVEEVKHQNAIRDDSASAIKAAYVDRRISDGQLDTYLGAIYNSDEDRAAHVTALRTIRDLNTKRLSPTEALACVKATVLPIAAYREALRLDGYDEEAVLALELLLETQLNAAADVEDLRRRKVADAAAAKQAAAEAAAQKQAAVDASRELARRGSLADLKRAVVRGLIPTSRYVEVLTPQYDGDTVNTLVALVEQERADYVAQQQKADDAAKRATLRHIDVGGLQTAYFEGILTLGQVRQALTVDNFAPGDADILVATMQAKKADLDAATAARADAAAKAKVKSIDLVRFEALVRAGHRSVAEYAALLTSLGYDAGSVAAMVDLLQVHIADDQKARDARAAAAAKVVTTGLTLEQIRRAVILDIQTEDDFARYLVVNKYSVDAQGVLLAELRDDVAAADAARQRRAAAAGATVQTRAPLATIARAARLGIISPTAYAQRLTDAGYTTDDIAIEMDLLAVEIADTQAARAKAAAAEAKTADRGLSLDQLAKAVKLGVSTMDDYRARAVELGYTADDTDTLVQVLTAEVQAIADAQARHDVIANQLKVRNLSLAELDDAVKNGQMTIGAYTARLVALGFGQDDADLLTTLLILKLQSLADAQARHDAIANQLKARNLSLAELDAAVKAGQMTIDAYAARLLALGFTQDDANLLTTLLVLKLPAPPAGG